MRWRYRPRKADADIISQAHSSNTERYADDGDHQQQRGNEILDRDAESFKDEPNDVSINIVLLINVFVSHNKTDRQSHDGKPALLEENLWITAPSTVEGHKNDIT